jgi:L-fuconolactonase
MTTRALGAACAPGALCSPAGDHRHHILTIDAHQHFWNLEREPMPWMRPEHAAIARTFGPADLRPLLDTCNIDTTILVQASCTDADTDAMFEQAAVCSWIGAVTAWVDLSSPERTSARLAALATEPKLRGIRHLVHDEADPHWTMQDAVLESLAIVEQHGLVLELPCVFPRHLDDVPELARSFPQLTIVIDHLGKPPLHTDEMGAWAGLIRRAAAFGNVAAKVSGLNTMLASTAWDAQDFRDAVEVAFDVFGPERLVCGSDWPVCLLNGDYPKVWGETAGIITAVAGDDAAQRILETTPARLYRIGAVAGAVPHTNLGEAHGRSH